MAGAGDSPGVGKAVRRRPWWRRLLVMLVWVMGVAVVLVALLLGTVVWILTPERLTPLVERVAAPYIDGSLSVSRVELTVWRTFPHATLDIDSLTVISNGLRDADLTGTGITGADSLLSVDHIHGEINLAALFAGTVRVVDVELRRPMVNAIALNDSVSNFNILRLPPSDDDDTPTVIPDIELGRFHITDPGCIALRLGDMMLTLRDSRVCRGGGVDITGPAYGVAPSSPDTVVSRVEAVTDGYRLAVGPLNMSYGDRDITIDSLAVACDGTISWSPRQPLIIGLDNFSLSVNGIATQLSAAFNLSEDMVIDRLEATLHPTPVTTLVAAVPRGLLPADVAGLCSTVTASLSARLTSPWRPGVSPLPSLRADMRLGDGDIHLGRDLHIDKIALDLTATIDGVHPDKSVVILRRLDFRRLGTDFTLTGRVTRPVSDPAVEGRFRGNIDFDRLPPRLRPLIPGHISGRLSADSEFRFRLSDFTPGRLYRVRLTGNARLRDFTYTSADSLPVSFYTRSADLRLGTNDAFTTPGYNRADSLLTASVRLDTMSVLYDGLDLAMRGLRAGVGCLNTVSSADTTQINPMGGSFRFEQLSLSGPDSVRVRMNDVSARATLRRYEGNSRLPQLSVALGAARIRYVDRLNRLSLRDGEFDFKANINPPVPDSLRRERRARRHAADSLAAISRHLSPDSVGAHHVAEVDDGTETVDMRVDRPLRRLIRRLNMRGTLTAARGRLMTPYFPLRNRLENFNMTFTTDSVRFKDVSYTAGRSDFTISGSISNISRFLTSRRNADLKVRLRSRSRMIDVNQLSLAVFSGAAFAEREAAVHHDFSSIEDEADLQAVVEATASDSVTAAFVVPLNIDASMSVRADTILYTDLALNDFRGSLLMRDGAVNLHDLSARTNVGVARLSALYSAPTRRDVRFGFGMQLSDVDLKEAIGLIPQVDSLMPLLRGFEGTVNADVAATADLDSAMNFLMPSLSAAIKLSGDSLVLIDGETFRTIGKWLRFKNRDRNVIDHMAAEVIVSNSTLQLFPFVFDVDRYRLGVMGYNDLALNLNYHISVLKSPLPFKFGINIGGNADDMKIRLGKARYKEGMASQSVAVVDTTRVNLLNEIERVFRRGARTARLGGLKVDGAPMLRDTYNLSSDTLSHADSLELMRQGMIETTVLPQQDAKGRKHDKKKK